MRLKRIQIRPHRDGILIVGWGLGERGQTPVIGTVLAKKGQVRAALLDADNQKTLGIKPDRT